MVRFGMSGLIMLCVAVFANALDISLSGIVKDMNGKPIAGATVTTTAFQFSSFSDSVTAQTDSLGRFTINTHVLSIRNNQTVKKDPLRFVVKNNRLMFSSSQGFLSGKVEIYSADGKRFFRKQFTKIDVVNGISIPYKLAGEMNILKLTVNHNEFTRKLLCIGNNVYFQNSVKDNQMQAISSLAKTNAIVDTLYVVKKNYIDVGIPLYSYIKTNLDISMSGGVLRDLFKISNTMFSGWKMGYSTLDSSFTLWTPADLYQDIDGGCEKYRSNGMLQAADMFMNGPANSEGNPNLLQSHSLIMDFGNEPTAKSMYLYQKEQYYDTDALLVGGYGDSVAFAKAALTGVTLYSYYKQFYFELIMDQYTDIDQAMVDVKMFLDYFISKVK